MINITEKVKASKMRNGSFIDIPTKFVKSAKLDDQRTIQVKPDGSYYYSFNPHGHRRHLYMIEIKAKEGFYIISEEEHQNIKRIATHGKTKAVELTPELCDRCTIEPRVKKDKYCVECGEFADDYYMNCPFEDVDKPLPPIPNFKIPKFDYPRKKKPDVKPKNLPELEMFTMPKLEPMETPTFEDFKDLDIPDIEDFQLIR